MKPYILIKLLPLICNILTVCSEITDYYLLADMLQRSNNWPSLGHAQSEGSELDLVRALIGGNYSRLVKPKSNVSNAEEGITPLIVKARIYFIRIQEIIEASESFESTVRFQLKWVDPALMWNPADYGGRTSVVVPGALLWRPSLQITNAIDDMYRVLHDQRFSFRVWNDGSVWFHPTGKLLTHCKYDTKYFPYDYQVCLIILESVIYQDEELRLILHDNKSAISFEMLAENEAWDLIKEDAGGYSTSFVSDVDSRFSRIHFRIVMKRKPAFYELTMIIPMILLAVVTLSTYLVPIHYVDRTIQAVTVLLTTAVFEVDVSDRMPKTNSAGTVVTILLTGIMTMGALTVFTASICLAMVDPGEFILAPWGIPNIASRIYDFAMHTFGYRRKNKLGNHSESQASEKSDRKTKNNSSTERPNGGHPVTLGITDAQNTVMESDSISLSRQSGDEIENRQVRFPIHRKSSSPSARRRFQNTEDRSHHEVVPRHVNEPERHLNKSKTAWYMAYAINWIAFALCLIAIIAILIYAYVSWPNGPSKRFIDSREIEAISADTSTYYGDY